MNILKKLLATGLGLVMCCPFVQKASAKKRTENYTAEKDVSDTADFLNDLNSIDPRSEEGRKIQSRESRRKQEQPSRYGRETAGKIRGKVPPGTVTSPGARLGGDG